MFLLVGLGNPGASYALNRHNVGFMALDVLADNASFPNWRKKFGGEITSGTVAGEQVLLLKPLTYMNRSGRSVQEAIKFYKIPTENVIVFHDDLELPPSKLRVKIGGGHGGHNGLRDIDQQIGKEYKRVRIGVGRPLTKEDVSPYVLSNFPKSYLNEELPTLLRNITESVPLLLENQDSEFMNRAKI
ncbi:MAG: aminoacyl-tRNA hydrolase [Alphaproteobacteria bacterium]